MPNWIEGTMKIRGKANAIQTFIENTIENVVKHEYETDIEYDLKEWAYIDTTRRAFVDESCYVYINCAIKENQTITIPIKQAWSFTPSEECEQKWINFAKEYSIDIRLQGFECGLEFYQDFAVVNGEVVIDEVRQYEDWNWDCPMPRLGG